MGKQHRGVAGAAWEKQQVVGKRGEREWKETIRDVLKIKKLCAFSTARDKNRDGVPGKAGILCPCES